MGDTRSIMWTSGSSYAVQVKYTMIMRDVITKKEKKKV